MVEPEDDPAWPDFERWLSEQGYLIPTAMPGGGYLALLARPYNVRLVLGMIGDRSSLVDGWCYSSLTAASIALTHWWLHPDLGEPVGWFRHPRSGRRVAQGPGEYDEDGRLVEVGQTYRRA